MSAENTDGFATTLGKFHVIASLGHGGMADVFLAILRGASDFAKLVVVKSMRSSVEGDERFRSMLLDEARLAARLRHPNVVQTLEVGETNGTPFIAMEYLEGQPLNVVVAAARRTNEPLGVGFAAYVMREALAGLEYAHELKDYDGSTLGIVHRDISPHNIFVTYEGEVKILDFGIAKASTNVSKTELGGVKGKIAYMAPEQARGEPIDRRIDLFASGLCLWELLASQRMLEGDTTAAILNKLLNEPLPAVGHGVPAELEAVVARSVAKKPEDRFQTAEEMGDALQPFCQGVDRVQVGRRLRGMFEAERAAIQKQIRAAMQPAASTDDAPTITTTGPLTLPLPSIGIAEAPSKAPEPQTQTTTATATGTGTGVPNTLSVPAQPISRPSRTPMVVGLVLVAVAVAGVGVYAKRRSDAAHAGQGPAVAPSAAPLAGEVILRVDGPDIVGKDLAPALVDTFFKGKGASTAVTKADDGITRVVATLPGKATPQVTEITARGSATAFTGLRDGRADVVMSARRVTTEEAEALVQAGRGDPKDSASEHVIGVDAVAVVVHPNSKLRALTLAQLAAVFHGATTDWASLGAGEGPIALYVREQSASFELAKDVFGGENASPTARRVADGVSVADSVSAEPNGIGFVPLADVRTAKILAVASAAGVALYPTASTLGTESYPLARRLFLYTPRASTNATAQPLVAFALSHEGQQMVRAAGFVDLGISAMEADPCTSRCPPRYAAIVKQARRLSLDFRFRPGTVELDSRAPDAERLARFVKEREGRVALLGFSDSGADSAAALQDSIACANAVDALLRERGVKAGTTAGFGDAMPLAAPVDPQHHQRNRRVEVWLMNERGQASAFPAPAKTRDPAPNAPAQSLELKSTR